MTPYITPPCDCCSLYRGHYQPTTQQPAMSQARGQKTADTTIFIISIFKMPSLKSRLSFDPKKRWGVTILHFAQEICWLPWYVDFPIAINLLKRPFLLDGFSGYLRSVVSCFDKLWTKHIVVNSWGKGFYFKTSHMDFAFGIKVPSWGWRKVNNCSSQPSMV